jgi:hypothetical protein
VLLSDARLNECTCFPAGSGRASAAAASGSIDMAVSVCAIPMRSARSPTNGTLKPAVPQANPIISDETVAALIGAIDCPNVTFTGNVD